MYIYIYIYDKEQANRVALYLCRAFPKHIIYIYIYYNVIEYYIEYLNNSYRT